MLKSMLSKLETDLSNILGGALSEEVGKMLEVFAANSESIKS